MADSGGSPEAVTAEAALKRAEIAFTQAGLHDARVDAKALFLSASGWSAETLLLRGTEKLDPAVQQRFEAMIAARCRRMPVSDIIGHVWFYGYRLATSPDTLTPRVDSEVLVDVVLEAISGLERPRVVDLGTGSSCLAIAIAGKRPDARVVGVDVSDDALKQAKRNIADNGLTDRIRLVRADFSDPSVDLQQADCVVSNPPYITSEEMSELSPEVRDHDPRLALHGGRDGLDHYRTIVRRAGEELRSGSVLAVEIGWRQAASVSTIFLGSGFPSPTVRKDLSGNDRVVFAQKP